MLLYTALAIISPSQRAKTVGPEPLIPAPKAPAFVALFLISSKNGIKDFLAGSAIMSTNELLIRL